MSTLIPAVTKKFSIRGGYNKILTRNTFSLENIKELEDVISDSIHSCRVNLFQTLVLCFVTKETTGMWPFEISEKIRKCTYKAQGDEKEWLKEDLKLSLIYLNFSKEARLCEDHDSASQYSKAARDILILRNELPKNLMNFLERIGGIFCL